MVTGKQYQLSPQSAENTEFDTSRAVSVRDFKILRQRTAEDGAKLQAQITVNSDEIALRATKTYVDGQDSNLQSQITVNANAIILKASQTDLSSLGTRVTTAESTLTVQAGQIATRVSTTDLATTLTNYSTITQTANAIATRVATTDYNGNTIASLINQTATTIQISAAKVNLNGFVTVTALNTAGQTTINGANISTGTIRADRLLVGTSLGGANRIFLNNSTISIHGNNSSDASLSLVSSSGTARIYSRSMNSQPTISMDASLYVDDGIYAGGGIIPRADNMYNIGFNSARWVDVWAVDGTINTSDMTDKKDIKKLENSSVAFIKALKPVKFKWKTGKREHLGFLAQEVKQAMDATIGDAGIFVDPSIEIGRAHV